MRRLVIVGSPAKARKLASYLGANYVVESSRGHIRDLPRNASDVPAKFKGEPWARLALVVTDWFTARWPDRSFEVRPGFGHRRATADVNGVLQMPKWARSEMVLLHEVAHCLTPWSHASHGPEYAGVLLALVRRGIGPATAQALEDAFARHRVRCSADAVPFPAGTRERGELSATFPEIRSSPGPDLPTTPEETTRGT